MFQQGQRSADRYFTILFRPNTLNHPRLGFAISKQKIRLAVGRNRLRRLVRESFRKRAAGLPPVDLVFLARDAITAATNGEIVTSLEKHWARIEAGAPKLTGNGGT
ncbi:MAG: ribonuclease P protein component [Chromatiales bacterium]|nr:ribonuclease P protein component [Chromatiales bacterium]